MTLYQARLRTPEAALAVVESGQRVYVHMGAAAPQALLQALCGHSERLRDVEILHCITIGPALVFAYRAALAIRSPAP